MSNKASPYSLRQNYGSDFVIARVQSLCVWICASRVLPSRLFVHLPGSLDVGKYMDPVDMIFPGCLFDPRFPLVLIQSRIARLPKSHWIRL